MPVIEVSHEPAQFFELPDFSRIATGGALVVAGAATTGFAPGVGKLVGAAAAAAGIFLLVRSAPEEETSPLLAAGAPDPSYAVTVSS